MLTVASCHLGGSGSSYSGKLLLEQQGALSHLFLGYHPTILSPGFCYVTVMVRWLFKFELQHVDIPNQN